MQEPAFEQLGGVVVDRLACPPAPAPRCRAGLAEEVEGEESGRDRQLDGLEDGSGGQGELALAAVALEGGVTGGETSEIVESQLGQWWPGPACAADETLRQLPSRNNGLEEVSRGPARNPFDRKILVPHVGEPEPRFRIVFAEHCQVAKIGTSDSLRVLDLDSPEFILSVDNEIYLAARSRPPVIQLGIRSRVCNPCSQVLCDQTLNRRATNLPGVV